MTNVAVIAELQVDPSRMTLYVEGWQSWSRAYRLRWDDVSPEPAHDRWRTHFYRPGLAPTPQWPWRAEGGLLAIEPGNGDPIHLFTPTGPTEVPLLVARPAGDHTVVIASDRPCETSDHQGPLDRVLQQWASEWGRRLGVDIKGNAPSGWCSWFFRPSDTVRIAA